MSDYICSKYSTLEIFPTELFIELFSFIKPIDLYIGFLNLNSRINTILHSISIHIHIVNNEYYEQHKDSMNYFANQIIYLAIDCHWSYLSNNISLRSYPNLRSLHLPMASHNQCQEIQPKYLPFLTNLTIHDIAFKSILFSLNKFSNLLTCHVLRVYSSIIYRIESNQFCLTLQSLHLYFCTIHDLFDILQFIPNLNYLEVILASMNETVPYLDIKHKNLSHLKVKLRQLDPDLEVLLESMPNLSRLEFLWNDYYHWDVGKNFDFEKFADILDKHSNSLKHIDINLRLFKLDCNIDIIRCLNPQWFSLLSIQRILSDGSMFISTKRLAVNTEENMIKNLLQSTYMIQRNKRIDQTKT
jgi:hypothetical protein